MGRYSQFGTLNLLAALVLTAAPLAQAQSPAAESATRVLLEKAHTLEARGRVDMAAQTWQQVLLADPNNTEALGGLARAAKMAGNQALANMYLERLKAINPNDPGIARAEGVMAQSSQNSELQRAGKLAAAGNYTQAMSIYRRVFGDKPPAGDWSLAYYETESATPDGRPHAIAGLRALVQRYPDDVRYQVALGRILTYDPRTREEGRRILERHPNDAQAADALRQSLTWDAANPATAGDIRNYLQHHKDAELEGALHKDEQQLRSSRAAKKTRSPELPEDVTARVEARARNAEEQAAFAALNAKRYPEAEQRLKALLAANPNNPRALAGMGYLRMNQQNFGGAISFLEQAKQDGSTDKGLEPALATSRFYYTLGEGGAALDENDLTSAEQYYRQALTMRPSSPEALQGVSGTLLKAQQPQAALPVVLQWVKLQPSSPAAWRSLLLAESQAGNPAGALAAETRIPSAVRAQLMRDPEYLRTLASVYVSVGRDADAQRVLRAALDLPFPPGARGVRSGTELQYASLLLQANHTDQAAGLFRQVLADDPENVLAWQGLIDAQHSEHNDAAALQTLESMPPVVYDQALRDPGFLATAASIYQAQNKPDIAQSLLERAIAQQNTTGQKVPVSLQVQLAGLYLQKGQAREAFPIYRRVLSENPDRVDAWKGLLDSLHTAGRDREALAEIQQIPPAVRHQLEGDTGYLQTVGGIYNSLGDSREAMVFLNRVRQHYAVQHAQAPADIDIQNAWLLYNGGNDTGLYRQLLVLGSRPDLTDEQRRTVQTIWANWAVRRANQAAAAGSTQRALAILNAAAKAFPDNPAVIKALAGGYVRAGLPKQAVMIFRSQDMTSASASDYKAAVGAALAANDLKDAETWLRYGLEQYPHDGQMLNLAARFEQARGDSGRAAEYYRASLAAMPEPDPGAELANVLSQPSPLNPRALPTQSQSQGLAALLAPGADATAAPQPQKPYLPSYSNQYGDAPVQINGAAPQPPYGSQTGGYEPQSYSPGGAYAVPSYMSNKSAQTSRTSARETQTTRLRDYVPPSTSENILGTDRGTYEPFSSAPGQGGMQRAAAADPGQDGANEYQRQQIQRLTLFAQAADQYPAPRAEGAQSGDYNGEVYGPYVPYMPSSSRTAPAVSYSANPVDLSPASRAAAMQNAGTHSRGRSVHPEIAAADAAETRRQRAHAHAVEGQSTPPPDGMTAGGLHDAQYGGNGYSGTQYGSDPALTPPPGQVPQPSSIPATAPTSEAETNSGIRPQAQPSYSSVPAYGKSSNPPVQEAQAYGQQYPQPVHRRSAPTRKTYRSRSQSVATGGPAAPPMYYPSVPTGLSSQPYPDLPPYNNSGQPPTDQMLAQRDIPPLRGAYSTPEPGGPPLTERQQTELDLATLEASYSGWVGGTGALRYRSGTPGVDRLFDYEIPFEASVVAAKNVRFTVVPRAVFLNSGTYNSATATTTQAVPILGTLPNNAVTSPSPQFASGIGGELQLTTANLGLAVGYTPYEFLISNVTGRFRYRPFGGPVTFFADRDSVRETELSYAGLRDPGSVTPVYAGNVWGGVVSTGGGVRMDFGNERAGLYFEADGADLSGYHVLENRKYEGTMGAYFRVKDFPGYGSLNVGGSVFGMHFDHNERALTYGNGGYFSPNSYFLGDVPITYSGYYKKDFHYVVTAGVGVQTFQEDRADLFPLDPSIQTGAYSGCTIPQISTHTCASAELPVNTNTGVNFNLSGEASYRIADHWYVGGSLAANNTNNYEMVQSTFFVRYLFRTQYPNDNYPTGLFPSQGFRPLRVP